GLAPARARSRAFLRGRGAAAAGYRMAGGVAVAAAVASYSGRHRRSPRESPMSDLSSPWSEPVDLVVVGLGYVGLPLVAEAVRAGMSVVGLDTDAAKVAHLAAGRSPIDDVDDAGVAALLQAGWRPTTDPACIAAA